MLGPRGSATFISHLTVSGHVDVAIESEGRGCSSERRRCTVILGFSSKARVYLGPRLFDHERIHALRSRPSEQHPRPSLLIAKRSLTVTVV